MRAAATLTVLMLGAAVAAPVAALGAPEAASAAPAVPGVMASGASAATPLKAATDQIRAREWHLDALRVPRAWRYSKGRGVTVAVLDTGVDQNHPDLTGQVVNGPDLTGGTRRPGSRYWGLHGTSMASIIAGHGHGPGQSQGMMGVAPQSRVLSVRVTLENDDPLRRDGGQPAGGGDRDAVARGIRYAVDHGAEIINMSLGGGRQFYNGTASQERAIEYALSRGVVLIASAGNDGSGANRKNFPAAYPGVIAVGALDRGLRLWKDSNRRSRAALCAPGVEIVSADASGGYVVGTGTSASSAMVAGVAALVRSRYPTLTPTEVRQALIKGSPRRRGQSTDSTACPGPVDAVRALVAAHAISKTSGGPLETPSPPAAPRPAAEAEEREGVGLLLPITAIGAGLLTFLVLALVRHWRRRRPDEDVGTDLVPYYGLPSAPPAQPDPEPVMPPENPPAGDVPAVVPLWQSPEAHPRPPMPDMPPVDPKDGSWNVPAQDTGTPSRAERIPELPPARPPLGSNELRPFIPGEYVGNGGHGHVPNGYHPNGHRFGSGRNGDHQNGHGHGTNGTHLNGYGSGRNGSTGGDDAASEPADGNLTAPLPAIPPDPPEPQDDEPPRPVPPPDEDDDDRRPPPRW
ncbi:hypothetical protein D0T12_34260 [Actinomadura spongiicola]|uniref:Peptidase S8/S53 domain-containing protein n=1 Tax=Actinomadura spongiicola TaxID=2303421 RepID=A0A372G6H6_9ACTN|nr:S8 family serine peptidase [Actinomadura spongiicola]RFS81000.1 hypothetical protein D0T12_34260 [Actinomadura spongiicola]